MNAMTRAMLAMAVTVLAAGCAQLSPQQVAFEPDLGREVVPQGSDTEVTVQVKDRRPDRQIGLRGGTYAESSAITAQGNLRDSLQELTENIINQAGYERVDSNPEVGIVVSLDKLSYDLEDLDAMRKSATATAKLSLELTRDQASYSNSFSTQRTIETFRYPSEEENAKLLNQVFQRTLEQMFTDPGLEEFLNR